MNYYISDLHIGHANAIKLDGRPFKDLNEMHQTIINNWNSHVKTDDTVYILGDFIWYKEKNWPFYVEPLAGKKVLLRGNHDPRRFSEATRRLFLYIEKLDEIVDEGRNVVICHYPIPCFRSDFSPTSYMLYGHIHQTVEYELIKEMRKTIEAHAADRVMPTGNFISVDATMPYMDYTPRTLDEIIAGDEAYRQTEDYLRNNL